MLGPRLCTRASEFVSSRAQSTCALLNFAITLLTIKWCFSITYAQKSKTCLAVNSKVPSPFTRLGYWF